MKVLILGGHGFIGKHVVKLLEHSQHEILALSRRDGFNMTEYAEVKNKFIEVVPDVIINCAAHVGSLHYVTNYSADVVDDNMQMTLNLYRSVKEVCPQAKIINPISNCSYPGNANIQTESEYWEGPVHKSVWSFANPKRMIFVISECYEMQYKIRSANYLVPNAYGPEDHIDPNKTHALNGMIIRMLQAKWESHPEFEIWGSGKPTREWINGVDLAKMLVDSVENEDSQIDPINVAQNKAYSIRETAEMIKELSGYPGKLVFNTSYQDGDPTKVLDDKLFRSKYPNFNFTPIFDGIRETIRYYEQVLGGGE